MESTDDLMRPCIVCSKQISKQAKSCPNCGQDFVEWFNPETKEVEYLTPAERKEKPMDRGKALIGWIGLTFFVPVVIFLRAMIGC